MNELVRGERPGLCGAERWLRGSAFVLAIVSLGFAVYYARRGIFGIAEFPFATNSVAKDVLLAIVCMLIVWDVRRWSSIAVPAIVLVHLVMPAMLLLTLFGENHKLIGMTVGGSDGDPPPHLLRIGWLTIDIIIVLGFSYLHRRATRHRYEIQYLSTAAFRTLMALSEVLVLRRDPTVAPAEVAGRVDRYLAAFRAREKYRVWIGLLILAYWPVLLLRPPFHVMSPDMRQRWIQRRFLDNESKWLVVRGWRHVRHAIIRTAQQFSFMGYYGDPEVAARFGYVPYSKRSSDPPPERRRHGSRLRCLTAADIPGEELTADVVVVGTGAAGSLLAYQLAKDGRDVLLLERGAHVDPDEFTEDEATQLSKLYADGALTLTKDFRFQVIQGMCVGGSTVVNNAVCIDLPRQTIQAWNEDHDAGLDVERVLEIQQFVRTMLRIRPVPEEAHSPGGEKIVTRLSGKDWQPVDANIDGCLGCGYCNIGCAYGRKLSALDWTLPRAQDTFGEAVRILADCKVDKVLMSGPRATGVKATHQGRRLTIRANTVVVSAGAIASSVILQRSGLGDKKAGKGLAFNMATPVMFDFPDFREDLHAERGLQITHVLRPSSEEHPNLAFETWFNPIVAQSLFMPGWFEHHWDNMRRYKNMTCLGVVTGTGNDASVKSTWGGRGLKFDYVPSNDDFVRIKHGVKLACEMGLDAGAIRVMPASLRAIDIRHRSQLTRIDEELGDSNDLSVNSAHPQGGNPISRDAARGVVDPSFRVYGTQNVYVCDASVFPTSILVNPQLAVMTLAVYAAEQITGRAYDHPPTRLPNPT